MKLVELVLIEQYTHGLVAELDSLLLASNDVQQLVLLLLVLASQVLDLILRGLVLLSQLLHDLAHAFDFLLE